MILDQIVDKFVEHPKYMNKGAGSLAKVFKTSRKIIKEAKLKARIELATEIINGKLEVFNILKKDTNVLIIGDTHCPFEKEGYLEFCLDTQKKYNCNKIIHIGDEIDNCAISQYKSDPDGLSPGSEAEQALISIKKWYSAFPIVNVCIGNHSNRMFRMAYESGIPKRFMKTYEEMWEAPKGWLWSESFEICGVHYSHGNGTSGPNAALKRAIQLRKSVVQGHIHTEAGIQYNVSSIDAIFGMQVGCGIDDKMYAFNYAKDNIKKSIISCAVVLENGRLPILELMKL